MSRSLVFLLLVIPILCSAQFSYTIDQTIPVQDASSNKLVMPWAGGLNAIQYNTMDLDHDNTEDLVLFDRMANKVITFLNKNNQYQYAPEFENVFPPDVSNWLALRDYNCDGKKDIFTGDILGIKVYINTTKAGESLSWQQYLFYSGPGGTKSSVLLTKGFTDKINLQLQYDDLPSIVDADGDGDLDIFNMRFVGNGTAEFHKNFSKERYGTCDSLDFERITRTWGNFTECTCDIFAFHDQPCPGSGRIKHAGGKGLLAMDVNGDSQVDLLFSEAACTQLFLLPNEGTLDNPVINSFTIFPTDHPVDFQIFPVAFNEDVDFDGKKDLIITPNIFSKVSLASNLSSSNWFYKNTGSDKSPSFSFIKSNFLQDQMIDVGDNAVPAFADYDGDGDYDLFISNNASSNFLSGIFFYENTGTSASPAFKLVTDDFLNFSLSRYYNLKIQFTDMNKDNTQDLVFTATDKDTGNTNLYFIANHNRDKLNFADQSILNVDFNLTFTENLYTADINSDGKADILAGRSNGALEYWKNVGQGTSNQFVLENATFLGLRSSTERQNISCFTADLDADGKMDLVFGDQTGKLKIISDYLETKDPTPLTNFIFNPVLQSYNEQNLGGRTWPVAVNLFNSTKPAIVTGNILGGMYVLRNQEEQALPANPVIEIYPNPVSKNQIINIKIDRSAYVNLISLLGQPLSESILLQPNETYKYSCPPLACGVYLLKFTVDNKSCARRIVIY